VVSNDNRIGAHGMLIAARCLRFGYRTATLNEEGEFKRVEGLDLADVRSFVKERWLAPVCQTEAQRGE